MNSFQTNKFNKLADTFNITARTTDWHVMETAADSSLKGSVASVSIKHISLHVFKLTKLIPSLHPCFFAKLGYYKAYGLLRLKLKFLACAEML